MWEPDYDEQARYWIEKEAASKGMEKEKLKEWIEAFIKERNTCALATASSDFVRCTPIEYNYLDGAFYLFSEGGLKFIGLKENKYVSLAIYDAYDGFGNLKGLQVQGRHLLLQMLLKKFKNLPLLLLITKRLLHNFIMSLKNFFLIMRLNTLSVIMITISLKHISQEQIPT